MSNPTDTTETNLDNQETQEIEVAQETPQAEEPAQEPIVEQSIEDKWDSLDLTSVLSEPSEEPQKTDDATAPSEDAAAFPSEGTETDAEEAEIEERTDEELLQLDLDKPAPLSRRKAQKIVESVIEPLRDTSTPIKDVLSAMAEFHPTRTQELAEAIVADSLQAYPNEWIKSLTGLDLTVEQIKDWAEKGGSSPSNTAPTPTPVEDPEIEALINELNDVYGESWKDPLKDAEIMDADKAVVMAMRNTLAQNSAFESLKKELEDTKAQLGEIKPQVDNLASNQNAELEQSVISTFTAEVDAYRGKVEQNSVPKILENKGLLPKESDAPEVKAVKDFVASRFQPIDGYGSDFDIFLEKQFSGRESMTKAMKRVADNLIEASRLEVLATRAGNPQEAQVNLTKARALKEQALDEQDALTVWTRKAATEFLDTPMVKPIVELLEQNAELRRRVNASGRPEIIGQTAATGDNGGIRARVQEAKQQGVNPFDLDISDLLGGR